MSTDRLKFESEIKSTQAAEYLETLASGLRDGHVTMESGSDTVTLHVADAVSFECSAKTSAEKGKTTVEIAVNWHTSPGQNRVGPLLVVLPGSQVDENARYAENFIDRDPLEDIAGGSGRRTLIGAGRANRGDIAGGGDGGSSIGIEAPIGEGRRDATSAETSPNDAPPREQPNRTQQLNKHTARPRRTAASKPRRAKAPTAPRREKAQAASRGAAKARTRQR